MPDSRLCVANSPAWLALLILCWGLHAEPAIAGELNVVAPKVLRAVGADSMGSLMQCWNGLFESQHAGIKVEFSPALSADGAVAMIEREADFSPFAREFFPAETAAFQSAFATQPALIRVASGSFARSGKTHALAIYVHPDNPLTSLSVGQLRAMFTGNGTLAWGDLGLAGEWRDEPVKAYGMLNLRASGNPPGIVNFMRHRLNGGEPLSDAVIQLAGDDKSHALQQIVNAVDADRFAIGYSGFGFANAASKTIAISASAVETAVEATVDSVETHQYPLSRYVYMAVRPDLEPARRLAVTDFLKVLLTQPGQDCISNDSSGFLPLTASTKSVENRRIEQFAAATKQPTARVAAAYWTDDGRVRVVGYNDMLPLLTAMNSLYSGLYPGVDFELVLQGTRTAPPALTAGRSAFAPMGAEFSETALAAFKQQTGSEPLAIRVAHASLNPQALSGPLAFFVHSSNPLKRISIDDASRIFSRVESSRNIETWRQLGVRGEWAQRRIEPCGLSPPTALATFLSRHKFAGQPYSSTVRGFPQSRDAVNFAATHPDALCFAAYNRKSAGIRALAVSEHNNETATAATEETISAGLYPLDRFLYVYVRKYDDQFMNRLVIDYLKMVLSPAGQALVKSTPPGYLPLNTVEIEEELSRLHLLETTVNMTKSD